MEQANDSRWSRRRFLRCGAGASSALLLAACGVERIEQSAATSRPSPQPAGQPTSPPTRQPTSQPTSQPTPTRQPTPEPTAQSAQGRLAARPTNVANPAQTGLHPLGLVAERDLLLYVPASYRPEQPAPLAVLLHGAGGDAQGGLGLLQSFADQRGLILLAPASRRQTWDVILGAYGPDIALIDQALNHIFSRYSVDPGRLAIGGFSDGASYALSVGIANGDLFTHVIAFSPGFIAPGDQQGMPRCFISHGTNDEVLPIDRCSRRIVPQLQRSRYDVLYREFDGPHTVPPEIAREAVEWYFQS